VAVVGATGAVGIEMIKTLEKRSFPVGKAHFARFGAFRRQKAQISRTGHRGQGTHQGFLHGIDIALFSAGSSISKEFAPIAAKAGCVVVDNSSAFRMTMPCRWWCRKSTPPM